MIAEFEGPTEPKVSKKGFNMEKTRHFFLGQIDGSTRSRPSEKSSFGEGYDFLVLEKTEKRGIGKVGLPKKFETKECSNKGI